MAVPSLPFSMSDINAEFGSASLATHFTNGDGGVGSLPGNMSEFEGLSDAVDVVSVSAGADINLTVSDNTGNWPQVVGSSRTAVPSPTDDGNYTYEWTKLSTVINNGRPLSTGATNAASISFSVNLDIPAESSDKERWQIKVTDGNGGFVTDTLDVQYTSQDDGP